MKEYRRPQRAPIATRLPDSDREAIERIASENDRTTSREVARAVHFYLAHAGEADTYLRGERVANRQALA